MNPHRLLLLSALAFALAAPARAAAEDPAPQPAAEPAPAAQPAAPTPATPPAALEPAKAQPAPAEPAASQSDVAALAAEVRRLKLEIGVPDVSYKSFGGLGPAASKVYYVPHGLSIGGYGEVVYQHFDNARDPSGALLRDQTDLRRVVLYAGYRFSERIVLNTEIEFEHAVEAEVEFAYLDFLLSDAVRLRAGCLLIPIGFVNEFHEPPFFHGVNRPDVESGLIPTTWRENGVGLHGEVGGLRYKLFLVNGLDVSRLHPTSAASFLRDARGNGTFAQASSPAGVLNLGYDAGPVSVGGTVYAGRAGQSLATGESGTVNANVLLTEGHAQLVWKGVQLRALYAYGALGDAATVSARLGLEGEQMIGARAQGGYGEVAYDVLGRLLPDLEQSLSPFVRVERLMMQASVAPGGEEDPRLSSVNLTAGLTYKPLPTVVVKADYQRRQNDRDASGTVNAGIGFIF